MTATRPSRSALLLADVIAEGVRVHLGAIGVLVRDVPDSDPTAILTRLDALRTEEDVDIRVAYLRPGGKEAIEQSHLDPDLFTHEVEKAEEWRNDQNLMDQAATVVVIAHGDEPKVTSLDFDSIVSRDLKALLVDKALGDEQAGQNAVQSRWWSSLANEDTVGLGQLIDYYLDLEGLSGAEFLKASTRVIHRLGLLPDPELFNDPKPRVIDRRLAMNRELVARLQALTPTDRRKIADVIHSEQTETSKRRLQDALGQLDRARWGDEGFGAITFQAAERLVKAKIQPVEQTESENGESSTVVRPTTVQVRDVATESLVDDARREDLAEIASGLDDELATMDESRLRPLTLKIPFQVGVAAVVTARLDVIGMMTKLLDDGIYGGLVEIDAPDLESALRRFDYHQDLLAHWSRDEIQRLLDHLSVTEAGARLADCFSAFDEARTAVLPFVRALAVEPLVVAANPTSRQPLLSLIDAYEALNRAAREEYDPLFSQFGVDAHETLEQLLLIDTVVVRTKDKVYGILAPTHPLYLWHYAKFCQIVDEQRERLDEGDRKLIGRAARELPNFLMSLFVPAAALGDPKDLPSIGTLGPLPYYGDHAEASVSDDGIGPLRTLSEAYLRLEPHARAGFRLALVDPPDAGVYLSAIADMAEAGEVSGAHVTVFRHPGEKQGLELRLDEAEEERVAQLFRSESVDRRFIFDVSDLAESEYGPPDGTSHHLVAIFDRSASQTSPARPASHPIQPLALPRRLSFRHRHGTVELEPSSGGPFDAYSQLVKRLAPSGSSSYLSVHQDEALRRAFVSVASRAPWTAVVDRHIDRDLSIGALRVMTAQEGQRSVAGFSRSTAAFRKPLRDVVRKYNAYIGNAELDDLLLELSDLLDEGILALRPDSSGNANHNRVKGLLGTLIAARQFKLATSAAATLLISLDGSDARRWLRLTDDPSRADLVGLEWTDDHCTISVIEVKAVQDRANEFRVTDGVVEGPAVAQMLSTRRLLERIVSVQDADELITTPARREVLREHLYRELSKGIYSAEERGLWVDRLQRLLDGQVPVDFRCSLVDVRLGVDTSSLQKRSVTAQDGQTSVPVRITELNERGIPSLVETEHADQVAPVESPSGDGDGSQEAVGAESAEPQGAAEVGRSSAEDATSGSHIGREERASTERAVEQTGRPRALLGEAPGAYGRPKPIWFDPALPEDRLPNPHIALTGETGSGKTQATKALLLELGSLGIPALILDFKDDYSEPGYVDNEHLRVFDPSYAPLPFNPLTPSVDQRTGHLNPQHHIHQLTEIIKRIYRLGDQQAYRLREAIKGAYESWSLPLVPFVPTPRQAFPPFETVRELLAEDKDNRALLGRMSPIFDLGLFATSEETAAFQEALEGSTVVRLGQLPGDETKNSVAEFYLMALYNHLIRMPQTHQLGRLLVLDEAWRLVHSPFLEPLMREGRAFGLGVVIATQFPTDLPNTVSGSCATKLFFSQTQVEQIREAQRTIVGKTSGPEADHLAGVLRGLAPLDCVIHNKQNTPFSRLTIKPYFERRQSDL